MLSCCFPSRPGPLGAEPPRPDPQQNSAARDVAMGFWGRAEVREGNRAATGRLEGLSGVTTTRSNGRGPSSPLALPPRLRSGRPEQDRGRENVRPVAPVSGFTRGLVPTRARTYARRSARETVAHRTPFSRFRCPAGSTGSAGPTSVRPRRGVDRQHPSATRVIPCGAGRSPRPRAASRPSRQGRAGRARRPRACDRRAPRWPARSCTRGPTGSTARTDSSRRPSARGSPWGTLRSDRAAASSLVAVNATTPGDVSGGRRGNTSRSAPVCTAL